MQSSPARPRLTANGIRAPYRSCSRCAESLGKALLFQVSRYTSCWCFSGNDWSLCLPLQSPVRFRCLPHRGGMGPVRAFQVPSGRLTFCDLLLGEVTVMSLPTGAKRLCWGFCRSGSHHHWPERGSDNTHRYFYVCYLHKWSGARR